MEHLEFEKSQALESLLENGETEQFLELLLDMPTVEACEFLAGLPEKQMAHFLDLIPPNDRGRIFSDFDIEVQLRLFKILDKKTFAEVFNNMFSDIRADLYQELTQDEQIHLLPYIDKKVREDVIILSSYPPETAGGIMNTDFATIMVNNTAEQALSIIRSEAPAPKMLYYIYVIDDQMVMKGFVSLKDLVLAKPNVHVDDILHTFFVYAELTEDRESVAEKIEKYSLVAIPVLNPLKQLVGIVNHDDALDVIREEQTEDMERFMGIVQTDDEQDYINTPVILHYKKRIVWMILLTILGVVSGLILHRFESILEKLTILVLYLPMIASTGGNAGTQSATVVIRALALREVTNKDWWRIIWKEARIALLVSVCVGCFAFLKVYYFSRNVDIPDGYDTITLASVITLALCIQVISATLIGAGMPLAVKYFGGDPSVAASPAITTIVDITGLLIYFGTVSAFLL